MKQLIPRIAVGAVIRNENGEVLLVLRNRNPEKDKWSIPGGKVDLYEKLEETVIREIKEEVNLDVAVTRFLCMAETINPKKEEHWVSVIYETAIIGGEAANMEQGGAIQEIRWFPIDQLPANLACFAEPAFEALAGMTDKQE